MSRSLYQEFATWVIDKSLYEGDISSKYIQFNTGWLEDYSIRTEFPINERIPAREHGGKYRKKTKRADLAIWLHFRNHEGKNETEFIIAECKKDMNDLNSGCGLNFIGEYNFLVIPSMSVLKSFDHGYPNSGHITARKARNKLMEIGRNDVGICVVESDLSIRCIRKSFRLVKNNQGNMLIESESLGSYYKIDDEMSFYIEIASQNMDIKRERYA